MKLKIFVLYDMKSAVYASPRFYQKTPQAMRMLSVEHFGGKTIPGMYPSDFQIMEIGVYDDEYATMDMLEKPIPICTLKDVFDADERTHTTQDPIQEHTKDQRDAPGPGRA